jgi:predicted nucleotidyltransferase
VTDSTIPLMLRVLRDTAAALRELHQPFALVGGLAISVRTEPRFTRDIDLAVAVVDDAAAERLVADLTARGFTLQLSLEHGALGRVATVRMVPPGQTAAGIVVDLLFASSGIEADVCAAAEIIEIAEGLAMPVAVSGHLLVMKVLARGPRRPQDEADAQALRNVMSETERARAVAAAERIEAIGANRRKALSNEVAALLDSR